MIEVVYNCKDCNRIFSEHHYTEVTHSDPGSCPLCKSISGKIERIGSHPETKPRNGSQTFYSLLTKAGDIHDSKSHDYADNSDPLGNYRFAGELSKLFSDPADAGLIGRFGEKLYRLSNLDKKELEAKNEPVSDTEIDLLVIIGLFAASRQDRRNKSEIKDDFAFTCANCFLTFNKQRPIVLTNNTAQNGLIQYYLCSDKCEKTLRAKLEEDKSDK